VVSIVRNGVTRDVTVPIVAQMVTSARIEPIPDATPEQVGRREQWLEGRPIGH
jgi:hypothetical protein